MDQGQKRLASKGLCHGFVNFLPSIYPLVSINRLIEAGGGRVVNWKPPYRGSDLKVIKFVVYDDVKKRELFTLKRAKVPMISCEDMIDYVIKVKPHIFSLTVNYVFGTQSWGLFPNVRGRSY